MNCCLSIYLVGLTFTCVLFQERQISERTNASEKVVKLSLRHAKDSKPSLRKWELVFDIPKEYRVFSDFAANEELKPFRMLVKIKSASLSQNYRISYPKGTVVNNELFGDYEVYEKQAIVTISELAHPGSKEPVVIYVRFQAEHPTRCLSRAELSLELP